MAPEIWKRLTKIGFLRQYLPRVRASFGFRINEMVVAPDLADNSKRAPRGGAAVHGMGRFSA